MKDSFIFKDDANSEVMITRVYKNIPLYRLYYPKIEDTISWNPDENYINALNTSLFVYLIGGIVAYNLFINWHNLWESDK